MWVKYDRWLALKTLRFLEKYNLVFNYPFNIIFLNLYHVFVMMWSITLSKIEI